ncbi:hypothetical protein Droror1_Dr00022922, partial [Drosera rotundifolia]
MEGRWGRVSVSSHGLDAFVVGAGLDLGEVHRARSAEELEPGQPRLARWHRVERKDVGN